MTARRLLPALVLGALAITLAASAGADAPAPFGPVDSRTFYSHAGTTIERPSKDCAWNFDWFFAKGAGVANAKTVDVSPAVAARDRNSFPSTACTGPDCAPILVKVTSKDALGTRTVTYKSADGRTATTTFDVVEGTGRCDAPKGK